MPWLGSSAGSCVGMRREVRRLEKVDQLINDLAENIINILKSEDEFQHEVAEKSTALANLISARAAMS